MIRISLTEESAFHRYVAAGFSLALFATARFQPCHKGIRGPL